MSFHLSSRPKKSVVALAAVLLAATALSGCTGLAGRSFGDATVTGSVGSTNAAGNMNQPMPGNLGTTQVADSRFLPPANVGNGMQGNPGGFNAGTTAAIPAGGHVNAVSTQDLPILSSSPSGTQTIMPAQQNLAPINASSQQPATGLNTAAGSGPNLTVVPSNAYSHTIQNGESLYTIARRYNVTTQAIVQANGMSSPDKIRVGQKVIIPGRPDLLARAAETADQDGGATQSPIVTQTRPTGNTAAITDPKLLQSETEPQPQRRQEERVATVEPQQTAVQQPPQQQRAQVPLEEPAVSGEKFRWPVSGRVITDFANSKGTGINIEVPEGAAVKATENGTVIYVGNGVEGYGNMILIRHANGFVSAYAHLKDSRVNKGATVGRGDTIGSAGMSGSVNKPQLHFELRKGATPVDPIPLLAS